MLVTPIGSYLNEDEIKNKDTMNEIIRMSSSNLDVHDVPVIFSKFGVVWDYYDIDIEVYQSKVVFISDTDPKVTITFYRLHRPISVEFTDGRSKVNAAIIKSFDGYISVLKGLDVL